MPAVSRGSSPSQQLGHLASGRRMKPGQDCAQGRQLQPLVQSYLVLGRKGLEVG